MRPCVLIINRGLLQYQCFHRPRLQSDGTLAVWKVIGDCDSVTTVVEGYNDGFLAIAVGRFFGRCFRKQFKASLFICYFYRPYVCRNMVDKLLYSCNYNVSVFILLGIYFVSLEVCSILISLFVCGIGGLRFTVLIGNGTLCPDIGCWS